MPERSSEIPWRQGHAVPTDALEALGLSGKDGADDLLVIVVSHDCDLVADADAEPDCEVIIGHEIDTADGSLTFAKSSRKLHLTFSAGSHEIVGEFEATKKINLPKLRLFACAPSETARLNPDELLILRNWLADRYFRSAFADEFVARMKIGKLGEKFRRIVKRTRQHIYAVLVDIDQGEETQRVDPEDTYSLSIYLLYDLEGDRAAAEREATRAAAYITELFQRVCLKDGQWTNIELRECIAQSTADISYRDFLKLKEWKFDDISLAADPQEATLRDRT